MPQPIAIFQAMSTTQDAIGNTRRMAGNLLQTGWD
jgi:hypothetical protein